MTTSQSKHRKQRLLLAYATTGGSKFFALGVQLIALPIAGSALSGERFGALFVLVAIGSFVSIVGQGFSPTVSFMLSDCRGRGKSEQAGRIVWTMMAIAAAAGAIVLLLGLLGCFLVDPALIVGEDARGFPTELRWGIAALTIQVATFYLFGFVEGSRAAYMESHITNLFTSAASIFIVVFSILAARFAPTIGNFYLAMFALPHLSQGISFAFMFLKRRGEWGPPVFDREMASTIRSRILHYARSQIGNSCFFHGTVYAAAHFAGLQASALAGAVVRLFVLTQSTLLSILNPFLAHLTHALASKDLTWAFASVSRAMKLSLAVPLMVGLALALGGHWIFGLWLSLDFPGPSLLALAFGLMGAAYMAAHLDYLMLNALGDPAWGATRILYAGLAGITLGVAGTAAAGLTWLIAAQALSMLLIAAIPNFLRLRRMIHLLRPTMPLEPPAS